MKTKEAIRNWFEEKGLFYPIDPRSGDDMVKYVSKLRENLPDLYQFLVDNKMAPPGQYLEFVNIVEFNFNMAALLEIERGPKSRNHTYQ